VLKVPSGGKQVMASSDPQPASPQWLAEISGGYAKRDSGPSGAFAVAALSRRIERMYVRGAFTAYRSTIQQADTAPPPTPWDRWARAAISTIGCSICGDHGAGSIMGRSAPTAAPDPARHAAAAYLSLGFDAGGYFRWARVLPYPTLGGTFAHDRLLRPSPNIERWPDYRSDEKAWTGIAAVRLDKTFGHQRQHYVGVGLSWHVTTNGMSELVPPSHRPPAISARATSPMAGAR
jgi:hypothetical protein